jgi:hypothetical protein
MVIERIRKKLELWRSRLQGKGKKRDENSEERKKYIDQSRKRTGRE